MNKNIVFTALSTWFIFANLNSYLFANYDITKSLTVFSSFCLYLLVCKIVLKFI